jgi:hypothetical protein
MLFAGMVLLPFFMNKLESKGILKRIPTWTHAPIQITLLGVILTFATPLACAIFQQQASIKPTDLEPELQAKFKAMRNPPELLYYNKGL